MNHQKHSQAEHGPGMACRRWSSPGCSSLCHSSDSHDTAGDTGGPWFGNYLPRSWEVANLCPVMGAAPVEEVCTRLMLTTFFPK